MRFEVKDESGRVYLLNEEEQELFAYETLSIKGSIRNALNPTAYWTYRHDGKLYTLSLPLSE